MVAEDQIAEKQDACYHKVKSRYKVWPSAYASGALVQCRKKGAANWGNKSAKESIEENFVDEAVVNTNFDPKRSLNLIARSIDEVLQTQRKARGLLNVHNILKHIKEALYYTGNTEHTIPGKYFVLLYQQVKRAEKMNQHPRPDDPAPQAAALTALQGIRNETIPTIEQLLNQSVKENYADGKGPGRAGESQRHGIPKGATMAELEKAAKASGRKGQLARWQINMRRGRKK
jgi:hypothetical protein